MKTVITIQHAQAAHHLNGMVGSWTDWELSELGFIQAEKIGEKLSKEIAGKRWKIYSSDLARARQTAAPIARALGEPIETRAELREHNIGEAVGQTMDWLREHAAPVRSVDDRAFPSAESQRELWGRISAFCDEIAASQDENILVVSHGFCLPFFYAAWLKLGLEAFEKCGFSGRAGGVSWLHEDASGLRTLRRLNDGAYLL
jgi:probable phosphoglycerate mutase